MTKTSSYKNPFLETKEKNLCWYQYKESQSSEYYYINSLTKESSWNAPLTYVKSKLKVKDKLFHISRGGI